MSSTHLNLPLRRQAQRLAPLAVALVLATTALLTPSAVPAQTAAGDGPVTVVISITKRAGASDSEAQAVAEKVREIVRNQPGLRSEEVAANINPDNEPTYVHLMHWDSMKAWEGLSLSPQYTEFATRLSKSIAYSASAFRPVK